MKLIQGVMNTAGNKENSDMDSADSALDLLGKARHFAGSPNEFWALFLEGSVRLVTAKAAILLLPEKDDKSNWRSLFIWPSDEYGNLKKGNLKSRLTSIANNAAQNGFDYENHSADSSADDGNFFAGIRLILNDDAIFCVVVFLYEDVGNLPDFEEVEVKLRLIADIPAAYERARTEHQANADVSIISGALDLMALLNAETKFIAASMALCNELASRYQCERVSIGWLKDRYIRIQAISHMEKFEKKMDAVQSLEAAMEEALDQDEEILWPSPKGSSFVFRDHESYAKLQGAGFMISLPLRLNEKLVGVVTCERSQSSFTEDEIRGLRVVCDQVVHRLVDLERFDRWIGSRFAEAFKEKIHNLWSVEHTFAKITTLVICAILAFLIFGKWDYRVESNFILKTDDLVHVPVPFDGYIKEVKVEIGDFVLANEALLLLDESELLLEESTAIANQNRYLREAEKARAQNLLADMKIALALEAQAEAQLKLVRYHLEHAQVKTPIAGIVVEGDLEELQGAPVRKGDILFKVAQLEKIYAELKVDERDVHEISAGASGEVAFVSRPHLKFPINIERIDPAAVVDDKGNIFIVRSVFEDEIAEWWRPGMSGVAKINVGKRNILWIFTHRTIDFLRILLWW